MKHIIANWKANKNLQESLTWSDLLLKLIDQHIGIKKKLDQDKIKIIICPPFPLIEPVKRKFSNFKNIAIGSQDISIFKAGSYTGEVSGITLQGLIDFVIIGHSERRKYFKESQKTLKIKVMQAIKYDIQPIFCIRDEKDTIPADISLVAYEPVYAIGSGANEPLEKVLIMKNKIKINRNIKFIYGGSVNKDNCQYYLNSKQIDGMLIGGASLDTGSFFSILNQIT